MSKLEIGKVKFFLYLRGFGYIIIDGSGEEIFFHCSYGRQIDSSANKPKFSITKEERDPKKGDVIIFKRAAGSKGVMASPYGFLYEWQRAEEEIKARLARC